MNFPEYHVPDTAFTPSMLVLPIALAGIAMAAIVLFMLFLGPYEKRKNAEGICTAAFAVFIIAFMAAVASFLFLQTKADSNNRKVATSKYYADISSYIDNVYGVKITKDSARDLVAGDETAGIAPTGETITLSLLNRDQKNPVLIGTDHNPIPEFDRQIAE